MCKIAKKKLKDNRQITLNTVGQNEKRMQFGFQFNEKKVISVQVYIYICFFILIDFHNTDM